MLFSSITFLYFFLPIVLAVYFLTPAKGRNLVLLISSLIFYGWGEPVYLIFMLLSIVVHYFLAIQIEKHLKARSAKILAIIAVVFQLGLLAYFKYADFFIGNFNAVTGLGIPLLKIALPIGISFYSFQILSYTIDVYKENTAAQRSIIKLACYVSMFPQLIAGPIVRYTDVALALDKREYSLAKIRSGVSRFMAGLGKKVILANSLGELGKIFTSASESTVLLHWLYIVSFTLQIYFDFSGYSDMAIGLGRILGFEFEENFNYPFISTSISEFWRRWHISLGSWFRDYLYIPLGGNRVKNGRWLINVLTVWLLTGFWHGAAWNFIIWGLLFALILVLEKFWLKKILKKAGRLISHLYVLLFFILSLVLFDAPDIATAWNRLMAMFGGAGLALVDSATIFHLRNYLLVILLAAIASTPVPKLLVEKIKGMPRGKIILDISEGLANILLLIISTAYLVDSSFNPFLYFRF